MAVNHNILYTTSTKSLKMWDLETSKNISDLTGHNFLNNFVRSIVFWQ